MHPFVICRISTGQWPYLRNGSFDQLHVLFYRVGLYGFRGRRIEWRYFRFDQTQDGGHNMTEDIDKSRAMSPFAKLLWP